MIQIPMLIHQTWKTRELPRGLGSFTDTWKKKNPTFKYCFYDDADCLQFVKDNYPSYLDAYLAFPKPVERADFFRYLIVYHYGGVYADLDTSCEKSLLELIRPEDEVIIGLEADETEVSAHKYNLVRPKCYAQWTFLSRPKHPLLELAVRKSAENARSNLDTLNKTGPGMWTDIVLKFQNTPGVRLLPVDYFGAGPHHSRAKFADPAKIFVLHYFFTTWKKGKEKPFYPCSYYRDKVMNRIRYARGEYGAIKYLLKKQWLKLRRYHF